MADLAASDVTVTTQRREDRNGMKLWQGTIAFGDGAKTVPATGVPCAIGKFGFARSLVRFGMNESTATGYVLEYDKSASTLMLMYGDYSSATDNVLISAGTTAPASATYDCWAEGY